jgi:pyruvate/2-oxoglutarate dehydrogenase complex dihydrolipoamide dehydrogenase (E3) component
MIKENQNVLDIAVIGGGPAGISACIELSKSSNLRIALFEKDSELGGIPRFCHHIFFGMRDMWRMMSGPKYAKRLTSMLQKTDVEIYKESTVEQIIPGTHNELHQIHVISPNGFRKYACRSILLTTGCYEVSRSTRMIPGTRPAGIYTTGALQEITNVRNQKVGNRAAIIGSEHVALSSVLTLKRKGVSIGGLIEEDSNLNTFPFAAKAMSFIYRFPIYKATRVESILDNDFHRVNKILLDKKQEHKVINLDCDTVIVSGKFRPYSSLIDSTPINMDTHTYGPLINSNYMTSIPNIYAAGNVLRGANMHDICALEGKAAAKNILKSMEAIDDKKLEVLKMKVEKPIRYVVPQKILHTHITAKSVLCSIQTELSLDHPTLEAKSGNNTIWSKKYRRLLGYHRIPIPISAFDLSRINNESVVTLRVK